MAVKIYERRQLVEATEIETPNGPKVMVREIQQLEDNKPPLVGDITSNTYTEIPKDDFEAHFTEVVELGGCC